MATRNERKRRAKARLAELQDAATKALALEAERQSQPADPALRVEYPSYDGLAKYDALRFTHVRFSQERFGTVVKGGRSKIGKFRERDAPLPLDIPENRTYMNKEGVILRGEPRKRYVR